MPFVPFLPSAPAGPTVPAPVSVKIFTTRSSGRTVRSILAIQSGGTVVTYRPGTPSCSVFSVCPVHTIRGGRSVVEAFIKLGDVEEAEGVSIATVPGRDYTYLSYLQVQVEVRVDLSSVL